MKKNFFYLVIFLVMVGFVIASGCTSPVTGSVSTNAPQNTSINVQPSTVVAKSSENTSQKNEPKIILDESVSMISGDKKSAKIYSFKELGVDYLNPGDTFLISVDSEKPINLLVTDMRGKGNFESAKISWQKQPFSKTTDTHLYGWTYDGMWYLFKEDEIYQKDVLLKIDREGSYYLILDPRIIVEQVLESGNWNVVHNTFKTKIKIFQVFGEKNLTLSPEYPVIINDTFAVYSAYRDGYQEYPLEDFGLSYLNPDEKYTLSINSEKPVNVLVLNMENEAKFEGTRPIYEMQPVQGNSSSHYGYTYPGLSYVIKEDSVVKKDITFTIKKVGKYFIMIDQRFANPLAKDISFFKVQIKLTKI